MFIFLFGSVWIQIRGLGSRFGVVKVSELFFLFCLVAKKVWEIRNLKIGFGFGVWMFIIRGVENGNRKNGKREKKKRERERIYFKVFLFIFLIQFTCIILLGLLAHVLGLSDT